MLVSKLNSFVSRRFGAIAFFRVSLWSTKGMGKPHRVEQGDGIAPTPMLECETRDDLSNSIERLSMPRFKECRTWLLIRDNQSIAIVSLALFQVTRKVLSGFKSCIQNTVTLLDTFSLKPETVTPNRLLI